MSKVACFPMAPCLHFHTSYYHCSTKVLDVYQMIITPHLLPLLPKSFRLRITDHVVITIHLQCLLLYFVSGSMPMCIITVTSHGRHGIGNHRLHYSDVMMDAMASQITSLTIVYSTVHSGTDQRKHQSSASIAFVRGIHRWRVNSPHKGPVTRKIFSIWWRHHEPVYSKACPC